MIGKRLKEARINKKLTQQYVANYLGIVHSTVAGWENDRVYPKMKTLEKLCALYEVSPMSLLSKTYNYSDISEISDKPITERTYEENIALTFFKFVDYSASADFLRENRILDRFGALPNKDVDTLRAEYAENETDDIVFAFHILKDTSKTAFLSMLNGLLAHKENLLDLRNIEEAQVTTMRRLLEQLERMLKKMEEKKNDNSERP